MSNRPRRKSLREMKEKLIEQGTLKKRGAKPGNYIHTNPRIQMFWCLAVVAVLMAMIVFF